MTTVPTTPAATERASGARMGAGATSLPRAGSSGAAPIKNDNSRLFQASLFWVGAAFLPLGLVVIAFGWYGVANTPFGFDQQSYIMSGGFGGLGAHLRRRLPLLRVLAGQDRRRQPGGEQAPGRHAPGPRRRDLALRGGQRQRRRRRRAAGHRRRRRHHAPSRLLPHRPPRRPAPGRREQRPPDRLPGLPAVAPAERIGATANSVARRRSSRRRRRRRLSRRGLAAGYGLPRLASDASPPGAATASSGFVLSTLAM